jgi:hypothetical protein
MAGMNRFEREMQVFYNRHADTLLLELASRGAADRVLRTGPVILHVSASGQPILLEIEKASEFLSAVIRDSMRD